MEKLINELNPTSLVESSLIPISSDSDRKSNFVSILNGNEEFILSPEGKIIGSNLEVVNLTGYEEWEIMGKLISVFYLPEENASNQHIEHLRLAAKKGVAIYEGWKLKKKGVKFFARVRYTSVTNPLGELTGYRMTLTDITHKVLYDEKIHEVKEKYQSIYNNSFVGILTISVENFQIVQLNKKAKEILGDKSDNLKDVFEDYLSFEKFKRHLSQNEIVKSYEFKVKFLEGIEKWVSLDCTVHRHENIIEGVIVDITQLKEQQNEISKLSKEVNAFIYHASHELRSPMSTILGILNILTMECDDKIVNNYAAMIREKVKTQDQLLKDLTGVIYNNTAPITSEIFYFESELQELIKEFCDIYPDVKVNIKISKSGKFLTDVMRFRSVLRNILSNSYKYNSKNNPHINIEISESNDKMLISISDNGIGMTDDQIMTIFNLFYRAHDGYPGNGLGLYLVKSILGVLNGNINIKSKRGIGTEVLVSMQS